MMLEQTWVSVDGADYGAQPDDLGPIGGGQGYGGAVTGGDWTARTLEELVESLAAARAGQVVFVPGETEIDLTTFIYMDQFALEIPAGVILAGDRGTDGSSGALLTSDALATPAMISIAGSGARVTGLRVRGPNDKRYLDHHSRAFGPGGGGHDYYYKFPTQSGIVVEAAGEGKAQTQIDRLEVDNCEISGFGLAGVKLSSGVDHHVHHSYIHHCQYQGLGYGIAHDAASSMIERNLFDWNRHSIAGSGRPGCQYGAHHNVEMGTSLGHCFDMHGGRDRQDGTDVAGGRIEISHNTFRAPERAICIRGVPEEGCAVHGNWMARHTDPAAAVRAAPGTEMGDNAYGDELPQVARGAPSPLPERAS